MIVGTEAGFAAESTELCHRWRTTARLLVDVDVDLTVLSRLVNKVNLDQK